MTKRKIKDRMKEHHSDILYYRQTTVLNTKMKINIDFKNVKKIVPFNSYNYILKRKTCEIVIDPDSCNLMEYTQIHPILDQNTGEQKLERSRKQSRMLLMKEGRAL